MGSMFLFIALLPIYAIILYVLVRERVRMHKRCHKKLCVKATNKLFSKYGGLRWNTVIEFIDQSYFVMLIMCMINFKNLSTDSDYPTSQAFNSVFAVVWFAFSIVFPFLICYIYSK